MSRKIQDLKLLLSMIPSDQMPDEEKDALINSSKPLYALSEFLMSKHNTSEAIVDAMAKVYIKVRLTGDTGNDTQEIATLVEQFATEQGFPTPKGLGKAFLEISKFQSL